MNLKLVISGLALIVALLATSVQTVPSGSLTLLGVNARGFLDLRPDLNQEHCCT